jgi:SAM-dependent methyltransferase
VVAAPVPRPACLCGCEREQPAFSQPSSFRRCSSCGLVYWASAVPAPLLDDDALFATGYYANYFGRARQWRLEARKRLRWLLAGQSPRRLLEVGCAGGYFLEAARRAGLEVCGVEVSPFAARRPRELGIPVAVGRFEEVELAGGFDAVCAFHVLEHVRDPRAFLSRAWRLLRPGGRLALEVPNICSLEAARAGAGWYALKPGYHLWHFGPGTLTRLLREVGFVPERCETLFSRYYVSLRNRGRPFPLRELARGLRATGSPRSVHPSLGDHVRVLARRP